MAEGGDKLRLTFPHQAWMRVAREYPTIVLQFK